VRKNSGFDQCPRPSKRRILSTPTEKEFSGKENCRYQSPEIGSDSPSSPMSPLSSSSSDDNDISYICHPCSLTFVLLSQLEAHEAMMHSHLLESDNKKRKTISSFKKMNVLGVEKDFVMLMDCDGISIPISINVQLYVIIAINVLLS